MLTYRVRRRTLKFEPSTKIIVPALAEVTFSFAPPQAFGTEPGGGRTAVRAVPARLLFNARTGQYTVESSPPLAPLELDVENGGVRFAVAGNQVTIAKTVASEAEFANLIEAVYYLLPLLLVAEFADPPVIENVEGNVGGAHFGWNLQTWKAELWTTTQEKQTERLRAAWRRLQLIASSDNRRLVAALYYFHVAARLERVSASPGEFLAEALLNYCKVLEVLFSPSRDSVRRELGNLGYTAEMIERDFIPVMLLRNAIDVAHVSLTLFTPEQLLTLHRYADRTEKSFRDLLSRVLIRMDAGILVLPEHDIRGADANTSALIDTMAESLATLGDRP
jgi:hypothetical protein